MAKTMQNSTLRKLLSGMRAGSVPEEMRASVLAELAAAWPSLGGQPLQTKMAADKLERAERLEWHPPVLMFVLERHGATALGSTRAELQQWTVDITVDEVSWIHYGWRQIRSTAPRFVAAERAAELAESLSHATVDAPGITRVSPTEVRVEISKCVPTERAAKQTIIERRRRFRSELRNAMERHGWADHSNMRSRFMAFNKAPG